MKEPDLRAVLQTMLDEIVNPDCHYWLYANYFDIQPPTERKMTRWRMTPLFIDYDALWNPEFVEDGLLFDVILKNQLPAERERIKLRYDQIHTIKRYHFGELPQSQTDPRIYFQGKGDSYVYHKAEKQKMALRSE